MAMTTTDRTVPLGLIVITRGALFTLDETDVMGALARHRSADWGDIGKQDWQANDEALEQGRRILCSIRPFRKSTTPEYNLAMGEARTEDTERAACVS